MAMTADHDDGVEPTAGPASHLFTVRLWPESLGDGGIEWRGQVRYVISGETRYFRDWSTLVALFLEMLSGVDDRMDHQV